MDIYKDRPVIRFESADKFAAWLDKIIASQLLRG
jgi:hypothetical protein